MKTEGNIMNLTAKHLYYVTVIFICLLGTACSRQSFDQAKVTEAVTMYKTYLHDTPEGPHPQLEEKYKLLNKAEMELWIEEAYKIHMALTLEDLGARPDLPEEEKVAQKTLIEETYKDMRISNALSIELFDKSVNQLDEEESLSLETQLSELRASGELEAALGKNLREFY